MSARGVPEGWSVSVSEEGVVFIIDVKTVLKSIISLELQRYGIDPSVARVEVLPDGKARVVIPMTPIIERYLKTGVG